MSRWEASDDWHRRHTSHNLVYTVDVEFASAAIADAVWQALTTIRTVGDEHTIYNGGASIARVSPTRMSACSGGEDGLDSLEDTVNDCLDEAIELVPRIRGGERDAHSYEPQVVREVREWCRD